MKIDNPTGDPDCQRPQFDVHFEERQVEQINYPYPARSFENAMALSEWNDAIYNNTLGPWIRACASPASAHALKWLHPLRAGCLFFSERFNPWMLPVAAMARAAQAGRAAVGDDDPFVKLEKAASELIGGTLEGYRQLRDTVYESMFIAMFGGPAPSMARAHDAPGGAAGNARLPECRADGANASGRTGCSKRDRC